MILLIWFKWADIRIYSVVDVDATGNKSIQHDEHIQAETKWPTFPDDIFKCIFLNENVWILIKISLNFFPKVRISNIPALVQIMAWRWLGNKPLSETAIVYWCIYASLEFNELSSMMPYGVFRTKILCYIETLKSRYTHASGHVWIAKITHAYRNLYKIMLKSSFPGGRYCGHLNVLFHDA